MSESMLNPLNDFLNEFSNRFFLFVFEFPIFYIELFYDFCSLDLSYIKALSVSLSFSCSLYSTTEYLLLCWLWIFCLSMDFILSIMAIFLYVSKLTIISRLLASVL